MVTVTTHVMEVTIFYIGFEYIRNFKTKFRVWFSLVFQKTRFCWDLSKILHPRCIFSRLRYTYSPKDYEEMPILINSPSCKLLFACDPVWSGKNEKTSVKVISTAWLASVEASQVENQSRAAAVAAKGSFLNYFLLWLYVTTTRLAALGAALPSPSCCCSARLQGRLGSRAGNLYYRTCCCTLY